jgi:hypothetical protein
MMPAYNAADYIGLAIESALAQRLADWELIVVDDGSTDATAEIAARYPDPRIRLLRQTNAGESAARNQAVEAMRGRYVAFLDADDLFHPDHLERTAAFLEAWPDADGVYTDGDHCDEAGRLLRPLSSRRRGPFEGDLFEPLARASDVFGPPLCVMLRRDAIERRKLRWDPAIVIGPDWDFFIRFAEDADFGYIPERTCVYRVHTSNITVRTGVAKRRASLALCREKTIRLSRFGECSVETRVWVFYDLLVVLLDGQPERQAEVIGWPQFAALPSEEQSRLLRLMAGRALVTGDAGTHVGAWLDAAHRLNGADRRAAALATLYRVSPGACRWLLTKSRGGAPDPGPVAHPLADLLEEQRIDKPG